MADKKCHLFLSFVSPALPNRNRTGFLSTSSVPCVCLFIVTLVGVWSLWSEGPWYTCLHKIVFSLMNKWLNRLNFYQESNTLYFLTILNRVKGQIKTLSGTSKQVFFEIFFPCVYIYIYICIYIQVASHQPRVLSVTLHFIFWDVVSQKPRSSLLWLGSQPTAPVGTDEHRKGRLLCECCELTKTKLR